jgi:hypothetical protein
MGFLWKKRGKRDSFQNAAQYPKLILIRTIDSPQYVAELIRYMTLLVVDIA